ncbi:probable E3 ubiquitin-protein ligase HERC4 isoform X4 [Biomphalaria glabrata]|uniref:Probable E3 ubiquitin-protein ligase HERC4 isoform X4 n=1 Tax=Biomphalaria glabrata TaxID=6526 RepID=A0A9W2ZN84_BIOGL|nr:probable E3 ubiquitin-protein ligase HERC4 isoform X4 [Biomphalaria glabrata]
MPLLLFRNERIYFNNFGQLGLNDTVDHYSPNQCRPLRNEKIKYICCGENHTACLTKDGRMFTFGLGTYGQLGHGSYKNELLPRLVIELSGSEISQIACGRNHTMAFDAKSEHLYTFGFGACGQLGLSTSENKNTPVIVAGSFILKTAQHTSMQVDNQGPDMKVKSIHAGGNHSFVIAEDIDMCQPDDYRIEDPTRQILTISQDRIEMLHSFQKNDIFSYELIEEMRKIFSNASCLNGSFLLPNEEHYNTNITKHGVDMSAVRTFFQEFAQFSNVELRQKILEALENLFLSMPECPLDEEALRVYLILPECHFFDQTELYSSIICPFAQSFLSLSKVNLIRIKFWWPMNQACFFDRLILIYKKCFKYLLEPQLQKKSLLEVRKCQSALFISLEMLKGLNEVNETNGEILPYNIFYVAELKEKVDIKEDYTNWTLKKKHQNHFWGVTLEPGLFLSKYPFLFDEKAKKMLLQSDSELKLQDAEGKSQNVMNLQWQLIDFSRLYLRLIVNRSTILQDTIEQLKYKNRSDLKKPFQIIIQGEEDVYQPVIQKEFFRVILAQIFNPDFRMFKIAPKSNLQWFCPLENSTITEELVNKFRLTGVLCGLGIYNSIITSLPFPLALYKKLLKKPVTQDDFRELDPYMEGAFQNLLDYDGDDIEDNFFLFFETLIPGDTRRVNHTCKAEYVDLYVDDILNKSVEVQFNAFSEGFHSVCDGSVLDSFHPQELHALVACEEDNDFEDLEKFYQQLATMPVIFGWGDETTGALGLNIIDQDLGGSAKHTVSSPTQVHSLNGKEIQSISSGKAHTLVCLKDGKVLSCGSNDFRQCGLDSLSTLNKLGEVGEGLQPHHVIQVAAGASHSVVLTQAHEVLTWGKNTEGQLGRGDVEESSRGTPKLVKSLAMSCVVQVACGYNHTIVLTNEGCVGTWGSNAYGQLGLGPNKSPWINIPNFITCLKGLPIAQVAAGGNHSLILSKSGAVYGWGRNSFGQLGLNDTTDRYSPNQCKPLRSQRVKYICCGESHTACLTVDGRVFTFGAGIYGQLGHGSYNNEILPRQVIELSGSEVSQIACGSSHTLAFDAKSGCLYTFGLGLTGQLGLSSIENINSPVFIPDTFVSATAQHMKKKSIYAGGDHSFVIYEDSCQPDDFRLEEPTRQILTLSQDRIEKLCHLKNNETTLGNTINELFTIFSNASCLNGSFLLSNEEHYNTTRTKHGIDMNAVRTFFHKVFKLLDVEIIQKISKAIEQTLYPSLLESPADMEVLRIYLILPECHLFDQPELYSSIICPFAKSLLKVLSLKVVFSVFESWWLLNQPSHFKRLVLIYKKCVHYFLQSPNVSNNTEQLEINNRWEGLKTSLEMLKKLYEVSEAHGQIIPYYNFYVAELKDKVNIRDDYDSWKHGTIHRSLLWNVTIPKHLYFCNYPFLFDGVAKSVLLQTDAAHQMQEAFMTAYQSTNLCPAQFFDPDIGCLQLTINRNNLIEDTVTELKSKDRKDFKKPLEVSFTGEEALDIGGVRKEFFLLLLREVLDPSYGMFQINEQSNLQWFNPLTSEKPEKFHMVGVLCGLAIYNLTIINLQFPLALFKKLLKKPVTLDDLKEFDPGFGSGLQDLLDYFDADIENRFLFFFEDVCPELQNMPVNHTNKEEYTKLHVDKLFNKSVEVQFKAFSEGFHSVCGGNILDLFHPQELQAMVVGNEDYDFDELERNTQYECGYNKDHAVIKMFWQVFHAMSLKDKKKFLLFLTGCDRIPIFGMKYVKIIIQLDFRGVSFLPSAHTCFNILHLPCYTDKETLQTKLLMAIQQTEGFGMM